MPKENRGKMLSPNNSEDEDELSSTDTVILNLDNDLSGNEPDEACEESLSAEPASVNKITKKSAMVVVKAVTGKIPEREELVKMLKRRFEVPSKSLTALKVSQILEVTARKLITLKYVSLKNGTSSGNIRKSDINVHREIDMLNLE
ncbi:uncharacterized protein [Montipora foliosa]|uniref:uncharacterized protein n=1 Tax=Montipora foliosa TaxID=591990 RepID=UPI0035F14897